MTKIMQTNGMNLPVKVVQNSRVVSYKQIAELHQTPVVNLQNNFKRNIQRFIEGVDYFKLKEKTPETNNLLVSRLYFTESGYLMLVKCLTDDLSWEVQRMLVNSYFRSSLLEQVLSFLPVQTKKVIYYRGLGLTQKETAKLLGVSRNTIQAEEEKLERLGYVAPNQCGKRSSVLFSSSSAQLELSL